MRWSARIGEQVRHLELTRMAGDELRASVDGRQYRLNCTEPQPQVFSILEGGTSHEAVVHITQGRCRVRLDGRLFEVVTEQPRRGKARESIAGEQSQIRAVMPGRVLRVMVEQGQTVQARQGLVVVEAMKMENEITSPRAGVAKEIRVAPGRTVEAGDLLVVIE